MTIVIARPDSLNTIDQATAEALAEAMARLDGDPGIRAAVLTGAGRVFCAGLDLAAVRAAGGLDDPAAALGEVAHVPEGGFAGITRRPPEKPLIAAVEGAAVAGGLEIALSCDLIVAGESARFGITEVKVGLIAGAGGLLRLARRLPRNVAMEMALTGALIPAERAHRLGLVNDLTADGSALERARELAAAIAANSPVAVAASKRLLGQAAGWAEEEGWRRQQPVLDRVFASADATEGIAAFLEKREPRWEG